MSDETYKYIHVGLDSDSNLLYIQPTRMSTINQKYISENIAYVYVLRIEDFVLSEDNLLWSKLDGYPDQQDDPDYKQYEFYKEQLIERYGSIEN